MLRLLRWSSSNLKDRPSITSDQLHKAAAKFSAIVQMAEAKGDLVTALKASLLINQCQIEAKQVDDISRLVGDKAAFNVIRELSKQGVLADTMMQLLLSLSNSPAAREALTKVAAAPYTGGCQPLAPTLTAGDPNAT
mmetsp:Transcript_10354/g.22249  ORF Transcript_10354/g.22249 Transcript_10354/m.22249 type:complete len:137 (-) Transcript_10354:465-875(-)